MKKNLIWLFILLFVGSLFFLTGNNKDIEPPLEFGKLHPFDYVKGNASSSVLIVEYSDFQCPACRSYYALTREIMTEFKDEAAFVYRHFPLTTIHPNAEFAARAAEAAGRQGKFWEMHDLLFEKQSEWSSEADVRERFGSYAALIGISVEKFKVDFASDEVKDFVRASRAHAVKSGLQGTPTFFVNGKKIENPRTIQEFREIIENSK